MSLGTDSHRYKQKLERLQTKVKKSELARKELEIRLQRLMKERNECEKSASIHKSKYNTLLEHERKRLNRNGELLEMLENVHAKATSMASNTERLKKLKNQQERILINNWRRSAYVQLHPNALFPNAAQYLPPATFDHQNHRILSGMPTIDSCTPIVYDKPAIFIDSPDPYPKSHDHHSPNITKSMMINPLVQQSTVNHVHGSSLSPIYHSELLNSQVNLLHPQYHENRCFTQQMVSPCERDGPISNVIDSNNTMNIELPSNNQHRFDQSAFHSKHVNDMAHSSFPTNQSNYNRYLNVNSSHMNYPSTVDQPGKFQFDEPFNKPVDSSTSQFIKNPQYLYSNSAYSPIERDNYARTTNQSNSTQLSEMRTNQNANVPSCGPTDFNSQQMSETMTRFLSQHQQKPLPPSKYDTDIKDVHLNDAVNDYEKSLNHRITDRHTNDVATDYYGHEKAMDRTNHSTRPDALDVNKSINTTATIGSDMMSSPSQLSQNSATNFSFENDSKQKLRSTFEDVSLKSQPENTTDSIYSSIYKKESNHSNKSSKTNSSAPEDTLNITSFRFESQDKPTKSDEKIEKRRSSIDAGSFAKTLGYDTDSEKESIAANIRRRYSVAANFLNLQNPAPNLDAFHSTPISTDDYRNTSKSENVTNQNKYDSGLIESKAAESAYDGGGNTLSSYDPATIHSGRIEQNTERTVTTTRNDSVPISVSNTPVSQYPDTVVEDAHLSPTPAFHENQQINVDSNDNGTVYTSSYTPTYAPDDQTYVENAMEQLTLSNNDGQEGINELQSKPYDDNVDKMRAQTTPHSKTVTWADDPNSNYKNEDNSTTVYETQNVSNEVSDASFYMENAETQQIPTEYTTDGSIQPVMETSDSQYQYQYDSQYNNNQYQSSDGAADPNLYSNTDYYENENQYGQYENQQQQQQPLQQHQQQEDAQQQMQYYGNDAVVENISGNVAADDSYHQYSTDATLQVQPKQDEYYTVSPGENYYNEDYGNYDDNQTYSTNTNVGNSSQLSTISTAPTEQTTNNPQTHQEAVYSEPNAQIASAHIPNYLQSDTDDSQIGYQNIATNQQAPQSQDSDFEFSINS